ncbi:hypothetical protein Hypma_006902 [Hypsizygus marmoreus]|uniref:Uncharacterized protein n=1 Tax=Hypsizygus marmoreus TaxID=39966 RepID=A0A369JXN3_HYPMA|nr:hypothetical protein Hypma_006902 [Hypsizygus marmoreus]
MPYHSTPLSSSYDVPTVVSDLHTLSRDRATETALKPVHGIDQLATIDMNSVTVLANGEPTKWNLVCASSADGYMEEMVIRIQGILRWRDLPPVSGSKDRLQPRLATLRQRVDIGGFDDPSFLQCLDKVQEIHELFSRAIPHDRLCQWDPETYPEGISVSASNRYFTPRRYAGTEPEIDLTDTTDPTGILRSLKPAGMVHTEDNEVKYFACSDTEDGKCYLPSSPAAFKVGDIVEAQISFLAVPIRDETVKMIIKLRALTMLSSVHTRTANFRELAAAASVKRPIKRMLRHTGYDADDDALPQPKIPKLGVAQTDVHMTENATPLA